MNVPWTYRKHVTSFSLAQVLVPLENRTYLYNFHCWALDNENANTGSATGLLARAEAQRREEYARFVDSGERDGIGEFVELVSRHHSVQFAHLKSHRCLDVKGADWRELDKAEGVQDLPTSSGGVESAMDSVTV